MQLQLMRILAPNNNNHEAGRCGGSDVSEPRSVGDLVILLVSAGQICLSFELTGQRRGAQIIPQRQKKNSRGALG